MVLRVDLYGMEFAAKITQIPHVNLYHFLICNPSIFRPSKLHGTLLIRLQKCIIYVIIIIIIVLHEKTYRGIG